MNQKTRNVSVRLDASVAELLDEQAAASGAERSDFLRQLISTALAGDAGDAGVGEALSLLRDEVRRARGDLATLAVALLVTVAGQKPEVAKEWVTQHLSR